MPASISANPDDQDIPLAGEDEEVETEDTQDESEQEDEYVAPTREEYKRITDQLAKVNAESKKHRLALKEAKAKAEQAADPEDSDAKTAAAVKAAEDKYRKPLVRSTARAALATAGLTGSVDRAIKLLDLDDVEVDENGNVSEEDLNDQIASMKDDFPELFKRTRVGRVNDTNAGDAPEPKLTSTQLMAKRAGLPIK